MTTEIKAPVKVVAVFDYSIRPARFKWNDRVFEIKEVTHTWRSTQGISTIVHFSATDGANLYELAYNATTMKWMLEAVS
ncbi:MAG: hypothetical protein AABZ23_04920 [Deltaproteobacteria bacterium]